MAAIKGKDLGDYIVETALEPTGGSTASPHQEPDDIEDIDADADFETAGDAGAPHEAAREHFVIDPAARDERLDKVLARLVPDVSRARIQRWIEDGAVRVNGETASSVRLKVGGYDEIDLERLAAPEERAYMPEAGIAFDVVHEDETIIVVNKPPGLVVHPAAGHWSGTLLNGLLHRYPELARIPRAGIVHRLDKDTSGLMVVARTEAAQTDLVRQLQARTVGREYWALVLGVAPEAGYVDRAIGRDPRNPLKFCCRGGQGSRPAMTHCRLVDVAEAAGRTISWVVCRLETGRTHQIRVHLTSVGLPLLGDPLYRTNASKMPAEAGATAAFSRQALHASRLRLRHPASGRTCEWFVPPPQDMAEVMQELGFGPLDEPVTVFDDED